jgi:hypothetical protein
MQGRDKRRAGPPAARVRWPARPAGRPGLVDPPGPPAAVPGRPAPALGKLG